MATAFYISESDCADRLRRQLEHADWTVEHRAPPELDTAITEAEQVDLILLQGGDVDFEASLALISAMDCAARIVVLDEHGELTDEQWFACPMISVRGPLQPVDLVRGLSNWLNQQHVRQTLSLGDILAVAEALRLSMTLSIVKGFRPAGSVAISEGEVVGASTDHATGTEALRQMDSLKHSSFSVQGSAAPSRSKPIAWREVLSIHDDAHELATMMLGDGRGSFGIQYRVATLEVSKDGTPKERQTTGRYDIIWKDDDARPEWVEEEDEGETDQSQASFHTGSFRTIH